MANASNKSKNASDEEEDDEVGEEEYEIEKIIEAQKGHFEPVSTRSGFSMPLSIWTDEPRLPTFALGSLGLHGQMEKLP
jgi:hypothetical protein